MEKYDVIILGAGASGLMCGTCAAERRRSVLLLEHNDAPGRKIHLSGGGRCNFTNRVVTPTHYVSGNPNFCRSALSKFGPEDFIGILREHGIDYSEREHGQLFGAGSSRQIADMLVSGCRQRGARILTSCHIQSVRRESGKGFVVKTSHGAFSGEALVVATGGKSYSRAGATDFGYLLAQQFGHKMTETAPALVGLVLPEKGWYKKGKLAGVSLPATIECDGESFTEELLFTHHGISGPVVLLASLYWHPGDELTIDLAPNLDIPAWLESRRKQHPHVRLKTLLSPLLTRRLAELFCNQRDFGRSVSELSKNKMAEIARGLHSWTAAPVETMGYESAEVTRGGVDTADISSKTMESQKVPGLYFVGEVLDVTGQLGGYNLHWAWASGHTAGTYV